MAVTNVPTAPAASLALRARANLATTPGIMQVSIALITILTLGLWLVAHHSIVVARDAVQTIGKDSVPSIIAAQQVRSNLADMDANAANGFFSRGTKEAKATYEIDRQAASDRLVTAAQNITYGAEERVPILALVSGLETYVGSVESCRTLGYPKGLDTLRSASAEMHSQLLPASDALDTANFNHLNSIYAESKISIPGSVTLLLIAGLLTAAALLAIQAFLFTRMKRVFNIPLAAATGLMLIWLMATSNTIRSVQHDLKVAKEDSFDSLDALWKARSVAYDANGDESLYLLESGSRGSAEADAVKDSEASFRKKSALIADSPLTPDVLAQAKTDKPTFKGYLGDELRNITFAGEQEAAIDALNKYAAYMAMDAHIRELETSGRHQEAVDFCTGTQEGQSNWGFAEFDKALQNVIDINQKAFDDSVAHGFRGLNWLPYGAVIVPLLVLGLAWLGLLPRLREYAH